MAERVLSGQDGSQDTSLSMSEMAPDASILQVVLDQVIPGASLQQQRLPATPIELWLIEPALSHDRLDAETVRRLWADTPYWLFCWASGLAMAQWLLAEPQWVRGRTVLDFGSGSGVVAIAACLAGAREVIACDIDPVSRQACLINAAANQVKLTLLDDLYQFAGRADVLLAADVLYDQSNRFFLDDFLRFADEIWVADSRVRNFQHPRYAHAFARQATTWPDLDESREFNHVQFYRTVAG